MQINKIKIKNFKQFKEIDIELDKMNIFVGNNESGKSTIIEAINLSLTGNYRGKSISNNIDDSLFNNEAKNLYISSLNNEIKLPPPNIDIEVYLDDYADFNGDDNEDRAGADGFTFSIYFDESNYKVSYQKLIENNELSSIPIEYYTYSWKSFSRQDKLRPRDIPLKSVVIDSDNYGSSNYYTSRIISTYFEETDRVVMTQKFRNAFESLSALETIDAINAKMNEVQDIKEKGLKINLNKTSMSSWEDNLTIDVKDVPFSNVGKGQQNIIKTHLTFESKMLKNKGVVLIEEPENHLSYSNLNKLIQHIQNKLEGYQVIISTHSSFVANKLGLDSLHLLANQKHFRFEKLRDETIDFFKKKAGYDTLRLILSDKTILVEGDSDELLIQRYYFDNHGKLPIEDGIDVISVGLSFLRFLELADKLNLKVNVLTDNDGNLEYLEKKYNMYQKSENIKICFSDFIVTFEMLGVNLDRYKNLNTLEPHLILSNNLKTLNSILGKNFSNNEDLLDYMLNNKTETALRIFNSNTCISYPKYFKEAIDE